MSGSWRDGNSWAAGNSWHAGERSWHAGSGSWYEQAQDGIISEPVVVTSSPAESGDDARENISTTSVTINETTLVATSDRYPSFRFPGLAVPQGATIVSAFIQFTAAGSNADAITITIVGFPQDNTAVFVAVNGNISARGATTTSVTWEPTSWTSGDRTAAQLTADLKTIVQEIVNRAGWVSGNAIGFRLERTAGTGTRTFAQWDHATLQEATLTVTYAQ